MAQPKRFDFSWDQGGVVDWIGRRYGEDEWKNPHDTGHIIATCSGTERGSPRELVDCSLKGQDLCTHNDPYSWMQVELPVAVAPTHYRLSHGGRQDVLLRSWAFCGSHDGQDWRILCQHTNDKTLGTESAEVRVGAWEVKLSQVCPTHRLIFTPLSFSHIVFACDSKKKQKTTTTTTKSTHLPTPLFPSPKTITQPEYFPFFRLVIHERGNESQSSRLSGCCLELFGDVRHRNWTA